MPATTRPKPPLRPLGDVATTPLLPQPPRPDAPEAPLYLEHPETVGPAVDIVLDAEEYARIARAIKELREGIEELKDRPIVPGPPGAAGGDGLDGAAGRDADCSALTGQIDALARRLVEVEAKLRPDADGRVTGLPPFWVTYADPITGTKRTAKVYLGGGYLTAPPYRESSLRGEDR